jgi:hypothetical protein
MVPKNACLDHSCGAKISNLLDSQLTLSGRKSRKEVVLHSEGATGKGRGPSKLGEAEPVTGRIGKSC